MAGNTCKRLTSEMLKKLAELKIGEAMTLDDGRRILAVKDYGCCEYCVLFDECMMAGDDDALCCPGGRFVDPVGPDPIARHERLRAAADAARTILANIDANDMRVGDVGRAFQLLDQALEADAEGGK